MFLPLWNACSRSCRFLAMLAAAYYWTGKYYYGVRMKVLADADARADAHHLLARAADSSGAQPVATAVRRRRPADGVQSARAVRLHPFVRCSSAPPTNVRKTRSSCSDLLSLLALLAVAVRSTSSRSTMSGSDSFMEHCGCAKAHQRRCGTAPVLAVVRDGRASVARACLQHAHAWLRSRGWSELSSRLRRTHHW